MPILLVSFLVMSTSATQPYGRSRASAENDRDEFIFNHGDDDYELFLNDQEMLKEQLEIPAKLRTQLNSVIGI